MARRINKLSARAVATLTKPGRHSDGGGLYLFVQNDGETLRRRWVYRFAWRGKKREMGLGGVLTVPLARARELAAVARRHLEEGRDPIVEKNRLRKGDSATKTFGEIADELIESKRYEWRNQKHADQWEMTLGVYAAPLRKRPVNFIDTAAVLEVIKPLWVEKPETAARLRGRIEAVLDAAKARGFRDGDNPARWRGHLDKLLPKQPKLARGHHAAMAYADTPAFVATLREREAPAALALEFCILTAARSGEAIGARWDEIDLAGKVWTIPAARMKAGRAHRVPLCSRAVEILERLSEARTGDFVFPGASAAKPLSSMAMTMLLRRIGVAGVTVHGFRSAFRDWAGNETHFAREVAEAALAHVVGDAAEQAYRRGDALAKRRKLMDAWGDFIERRPAVKVVQFAERRHGRAEKSKSDF